MNKKIILSVLLLLSPLILSAQQTVKAILTEVQQSILKAPQSVSFRSTLSDRQHRQTTSGELTLQNENFRLRYDQIDATYAAGTLTYYDKEEHTLTYSTPTGDELIQLNPFFFLRSYDKSYRAELKSTSKGQEVIYFTPLAKSRIRSIELRLQQAKPKTIIVLGSNNSRMEVSIEQIRPAGKLSGNYFSLKASDYLGCEVVDLR